MLFAILFLDSIAFVACLRSESHYIKRSESLNFVDLLETFDCESLCPFCEVIRFPRSRHCSICNKCVERYDHHCPWINNCVGRSNHFAFYTHLLCLVAYCVLSTYIAFTWILSSNDSNNEVFSKDLYSVTAILILTLGLICGALILALVVYQT